METSNDLNEFVQYFLSGVEANVVAGNPTAVNALSVISEAFKASNKFKISVDAKVMVIALIRLNKEKWTRVSHPSYKANEFDLLAATIVDTIAAIAKNSCAMKNQAVQNEQVIQEAINYITELKNSKGTSEYTKSYYFWESVDVADHILRCLPTGNG